MHSSLAFDALFLTLNLLSVIAKKIMETRPWLGREESKDSKTPMHIAVLMDKIDVLRILLEHDWSLGHVTHKVVHVSSLLSSAAFRGFVGVARELLKHCPDAPYRHQSGRTCLHEAVDGGHTEFVEFLLKASHIFRNWSTCETEMGRLLFISQSRGAIRKWLLLYSFTKRQTSQYMTTLASQ